MTVYESDLPGVGKKHEIELGDGSRLVVVTHNTGKREVFRRADDDADSEKLFELPDQLARQVGTILEGAYFQPVRSQSIETLLGGDTLIEWVEIPEGSDLDGKTLGEADLRQETGANVIVVQRGDMTITNPGGDTELRAGDTLLAVGPREACRTFQSIVTGE
ncbi:potassium transporter TrkA [Salinigranum rubrum]|uniref:Potassium transporter TrkA n=1 Tax=Salinigranum rubrum TaxID=755307 RepID=A0A2I8VR68_9EURY|nr:TrkA C-terminal domain-containing protein [Salinigranum rubrum]AUV83669.1 potassium transporter TrkA [Salinigranum rubrum]